MLYTRVHLRPHSLTLAEQFSRQNAETVTEMKRPTYYGQILMVKPTTLTLKKEVFKHWVFPCSGLFNYFNYSDWCAMLISVVIGQLVVHSRESTRCSIKLLIWETKRLSLSLVNKPVCPLLC